MNVLITGSGGFIGSHLQRSLAVAGWNVSGAVRNSESVGRAASGRSFVHPLGAVPDPQMFRKVDVLIHLAHDFRPGQSQRTIDGTRRLCEAAREAGVGRQMFVSSYSARADAASDYGRVKYTLEACFRGQGDVIVRPGLVLGNGGVFEKLVRFVDRWPVLPLVDGGSGPVPVIDIETLCRAMVELLQSKRWPAGQDANWFHPELLSLHSLLAEVCLIRGRRRLFVPIPLAVLLLPLTLLAKVGIRPSIGIENLKGYRINRNVVHRSNLAAVLPDMPMLSAMIDAGVRAVSGGKP